MKTSTACLLLAMLLIASPAVAEPPTAEPPVALRTESFGVPPSSQPLTYVRVKNLLDKPYEGTVSVKPPQHWKILPPQQEVALAPGETARLSFKLEGARTIEANSYPVEVTATGGGTNVVRRQDVFCASAPYFKPTIDGDPSDWKHAVPVRFVSGGKKTTVSTLWNRRQFCVLVAVEEDKLTAYPGGGEKPFDAVQLAISPQETTTGTSPDGEATRFEFLCVATGDGAAATCFQLAEPGMKLAEAAKARELAPLAYDNAEVAVGRKGGVTYYECSFSFTPMRSQIRPSEGREFFFSVLVHDADGTGLRDLGEAAGLWPSQRNPLAWSCFDGAAFGEKPPFDNKLPWGLCTSKY